MTRKAHRERHLSSEDLKARYSSTLDKVGCTTSATVAGTGRQSTGWWVVEWSQGSRLVK
jgi:hypothetical protein